MEIFLKGLMVMPLIFIVGIILYGTLDLYSIYKYRESQKLLDMVEFVIYNYKTNKIRIESEVRYEYLRFNIYDELLGEL